MLEFCKKRLILYSINLKNIKPNQSICQSNFIKKILTIINNNNKVCRNKIKNQTNSNKVKNPNIF